MFADSEDGGGTGSHEGARETHEYGGRGQSTVVVRAQTPCQ